MYYCQANLKSHRSKQFKILTGLEKVVILLVFGSCHSDIWIKGNAFPPEHFYPSLIGFTILGKAIQQQKIKSQTMSGSLIAYKIVLDGHVL